jgi:hypothetical protein
MYVHRRGEAASEADVDREGVRRHVSDALSTLPTMSRIPTKPFVGSALLSAIDGSIDPRDRARSAGDDW